jgi:hypothetical protein
MGNGWTPERRAKQAQAIKRWKPWKNSTGPRTAAGKAISASNATVHGMMSARWRAELSELNALLRECRARLKRNK